MRTDEISCRAAHVLISTPEFLPYMLLILVVLFSGASEVAPLVPIECRGDRPSSLRVGELSAELRLEPEKRAVDELKFDAVCGGLEQMGGQNTSGNSIANTYVIEQRIVRRGSAQLAQRTIQRKFARRNCRWRHRCCGGIDAPKRRRKILSQRNQMVGGQHHGAAQRLVALLHFEQL